MLGENALRKIGMGKIMENADKLNNYMKSVDERQRDTMESMNHNAVVTNVKLNCIIEHIGIEKDTAAKVDAALKEAGLK